MGGSRCELKVAPTFKTSALRMLMTGKAKEHFDIWEAGRDTTHASKSYEGLVKQGQGLHEEDDVKEQMQHGGDGMNTRTIVGWSWC
jgi:hypothetical protein